MTIPSAEVDRRDPDGASPQVRVALVARDRRFVRVTSFLLSRHGYAVESTHSPGHLLDLLERTGADVVVVDGSDPSNAGARTAALVATLERPRGLVVVGETRDVRPLHAPAAVSKWTAFDFLLDAIETEYGRTQAMNGASTPESKQ